MPFRCAPIVAAQTQPKLPIAGLEEVRAEASVWVVACPDADAEDLMARLGAGRTLFLDSLSGRVTIRGGDLILVRSGAAHAYRILSADRRTNLERLPDGLLDSFETAGVDSQADRVRNLLAVSFGPSEPALKPPGQDVTWLERFFSTVRHSVFEEAPGARFDRAIDARRMVARSAHPALLGLLDREIADATRSMFPSAPGTEAWALARQAHLRASAELRQVGLSGQADETHRRLRDWAGEDQLELDFFAGPPKPGRTGERIAYGTHRLLAHRFPVSGPPWSAAAAPAATWKIVQEVMIPDRLVCQWLHGLSSARLKPFHLWRTGDRGMTLEVGLDADFQVLLGLAGQTGEKNGKYTLRARGRGFQIFPNNLECRVGLPARLTVRGLDEVRASDLEIELISGTGACVPLRIAVPDELLRTT